MFRPRRKERLPEALPAGPAGRLVDAAGRGRDDHAPLAGDADAARVTVARGAVDHHALRGQAPLAAEREAAAVHVVNARVEGQVSRAADRNAPLIDARVQGDDAV